jgi:hypothetical protein
MEHATEITGPNSRHHYTRYTPHEVVAKWTDVAAQGNRGARERDPRLCVVIRCRDRDLAVTLSALFYRRVFGVLSCTHWDGETLSFYCGEGRNINTLQGCVYEMLFKFPGNVPHDLLSGAAPRYDHVKLEAV